MVILLLRCVGSGNRFSSRRFAILALPRDFKHAVDDVLSHRHNGFRFLTVTFAVVRNGHKYLVRAVSHRFYVDQTFALHLHDQLCNVLAHNGLPFFCVNLRSGGAFRDRTGSGATPPDAPAYSIKRAA